MPYDPLEPSQSDRSHAYKAIWFGMGGAAFTFANLFMGMDNMLSAIAFGAGAGGLLASAVTGRTDDYFRQLCAVGHRWAIFAIGAYLVVLFILQAGDLAHAGGYRLTSGSEAPVAGPPTFAALVDARTVLIGASLAFYLGFAFAWWRDSR